MKKLDETIKRFNHNAQYERTHGNLQGFLEFIQLVKWLKELRAYRYYRKEHAESLEQEPKTGHWYYDEEREATGIYAICSNCDEEIYQTGDFKYCPNCGCRMVEPTGAESEE